VNGESKHEVMSVRVSGAVIKVASQQQANNKKRRRKNKKQHKSAEA
jgi:hypothetical protein